MLSGLVSRAMGILVAIFGAALMITRAQPVTESALHSIWSPVCQSPCFMGIYPSMRIVDAIRVLEQNPWVERVDDRTLENNGGFVYWHWSAAAPDWIDRQRRGTIWVNSMRITQFWLDTRYQLGEVLLTLGAPDVNILDDDIDSWNGRYQYRGVHAADGLVVMSWQPCQSSDRYHLMTSLKFRDVISPRELDSIRYLDQWEYRFKNCDSH